MSRTAPAKRQAGMLAAGIALTLFLLCIVAMNLSTSRSRGQKVMEKTLIGLEQLESYDLTIVEKAPTYELSFKGRVDQGNQLSGILPDYDLEVLSKERALLLKRQQAPEWEKAEELGLQGLAGFLITPLELLQERKDCFKDVILGETINIGDTICKTAYLGLAEPEKAVRRLFPQVDCSLVDEMIIGAAVNQADFMLKQLQIIVEFSGKKSEKIERCYYID